MKKLIYGLSIASVLVLGACSDNNKDDNKETEEQEQTNQEQQNETVNETTTEEQEAIDQLNVQDDEDLKASLEKTEGVETAVVTSMDSNGKNYVLVDVTLTADSTIEAETFAKDQATAIKKKYKESIVDVKVLKNGETLAQSTAE